jgi:hypothetical protein
MPVFDLTDDERAALIALLKGTIDRDRFPLSPRIRLLRACFWRVATDRTSMHDGALQPPCEGAAITFRSGGELPRLL